MGTVFLCPGCGQMVKDTVGTEEIDSGTTLFCSAPECGATAVVDLFLPDERKNLYRDRERILLLPTYAMAVLAAPQDFHDPALVNRARAKVQEWLEGMR